MNKYKDQILYIDDEIENLHAFRMVFGDFYEIHLVSVIEDALEIIKNNKIKVLLVDQRMPKYTGLEFCKIVHNIKPEILCIIVSAHYDMQVMYNAINQGGIFQFMVKPWEKESLKQAIDNALEKFNLLEQNRNLIKNLEEKNKELQEKNEVLTITAEVLHNNENELLKYNKEVTKAKEKAEESDRLKSSFLANISHEIRTPLNGILGFIELLSRSRDESFSEKGKNYMKIIKSSSNQLLSIINDIIDISKIEAGIIMVKKEAFYLDEVVNDIHELYQSQISQKQLQIDINNYLPNSEIFTDKHKVFQIIRHLVDNAVQYTHQGGINITINKHFENTNEIIICIADTGIGIAAKDHDKIWQRFIQLDLGKLTLNQGNGVGLALVKSFVELLGGKIWLQSELQKGSSFFFTLPVNQNQKPITELPTNNTEDNLAFLKNKNVLLVEDEKFNYLYVKELIGEIANSFVHVSDGKSAVETALGQKFDLILMDIMLPGIDGIEATQQIREKNKEVIIIAQTAFSLTSSKTNGEFDEVIYKPFTKKQLYDKIKSVFNKK